MQTTKAIPPAARGFIATKEHRRYVEFATAVRRSRTIGLCYGPAGIGKTASALRLSRWNAIGPRLAPSHVWLPEEERDAEARRRERLAACLAPERTPSSTPRVSARDGGSSATSWARRCTGSSASSRSTSNDAPADRSARPRPSGS